MIRTEKTVSVVMATHNGSEFIEAQLQSIVNQRRPPHEIIVSDDASIDNTLDIVRSLATQCPVPIRIIRNERALGFRDNFLRAATCAEGDFVAFCDQDDIWETCKIEICSQHFNDRTISMIVHTAMSFDHMSGRVASFAQGIRRNSMKPPLSYDPWLTFFGFSIVFRRELLSLWSIEDRFRDFIVPHEKIAHDRWIMFLGQLVGQTVEIDRPLVRYRQHDRNLFGDGKRRLKDEAEQAVNRFDRYIAATSGMIRVVEGLPVDTCRQFPLFDRSKAKTFLRRALSQLEERKRIYMSSDRIGSVQIASQNFLRGVYKSVHDDSIRWRSIARDVKYSILRS